MNKRKTGSIHEEKAAQWLTKHGAKIIATNFRNRYGEIDLIMREQGYLVFVEVKYRSSAAAGHPAEAVTYTKQKTICRVADYYRISKKLSDDHPIRFDVIAICGKEITWYQNAFDYIKQGW